ncbi:hypothetical protein ASG82_04345 [Mycobacterium sp. Soil538]|nr:hypothetical protein ASG82_04345 [Mycobacterium sp. Soil538]
MVVSRVLAPLWRVRITVAYASALFAIASLLVALGPRAQHRVVALMSTNLHNLAEGRLGTLLASAFVTAEGQTYLLLPGLVCLLALAELLWRSRRLVQVFLLGHVGATLIVAAGLAFAVKVGWVPVAVSHADDVGLSYGAVAVLGTLTAAIPGRSRAAWTAGWLTVATVVVVLGGGFTAAGHAVALLLGMALSMRVPAGWSASAHWTVFRGVLLAIGAAFGLLLFVGVALPGALVAVPAGLAAAFAAWSVAPRAPRTGAGLP